MANNTKPKSNRPLESNGVLPHMLPDLLTDLVLEPERRYPTPEERQVRALAAKDAAQQQEHLGKGLLAAHELHQLAVATAQEWAETVDELRTIEQSPREPDAQQSIQQFNDEIRQTAANMLKQVMTTTGYRIGQIAQRPLDPPPSSIQVIDVKPKKRGLFGFTRED